MLEHKQEMKETGEASTTVEKGETNNVKGTETTNKVTKVSPSSTSKGTKNLPSVLSKDELATLDYADFSTPARMLALGEVLCKSQLVPLKKAEDVVVALMTGKELGLPFVTSVSQIYPINGRPTLGVHIQKAILLKNGIVFEKTEDSVEIFSFVKKVGEKLQPAGEGTINDQPKETAKKLIGYRTTYKFNRELRRPSGKYKEITAYGSFSTMEAATADLLSKDVWVKYYKRMLDARAFTNGAREIADDLLLGILAPNELSNDFYVNEQGEEVYDAQIV